MYHFATVCMGEYSWLLRLLSKRLRVVRAVVGWSDKDRDQPSWFQRHQQARFSRARVRQHSRPVSSVWSPIQPPQQDTWRTWRRGTVLVHLLCLAPCVYIISVVWFPRSWSGSVRLGYQTVSHFTVGYVNDFHDTQTDSGVTLGWKRGKQNCRLSVWINVTVL